jgi:nicotinamide N-methyltransferase
MSHAAPHPGPQVEEEKQRQQQKQQEEEEEGEDIETLDLFTEPADYYPPTPPPTTETYTLLSGRTLTLHLVGHNPLWAHHLWNGGRLIARYLEQQPALVRDRTVLELGAGAGLPSLVSGVLGARKVVVSDYPDADLVQNLWRNIAGCEELLEEVAKGRVVAEGYCWGADVQSLLVHLGEAEEGEGQRGFEVLILADLLFNHSEHGKLIETIKKTMARTVDAQALVFFTPYRPWLLDKDMAFFDAVKEAGFKVEKVLEEKMDKVMFEEDRGDEELRRTVFGYVVRWDL